MAAESRTQDSDLDNPVADPAPIDPPLDAKGREVTGALRVGPWDFDFFQAVRLLERFGEGAPVGRFANPELEAVRFSANPKLAFPASRIQSLKWPEDEQPEMEVNFLGLSGPSGVLPVAYSEYLNERLRAKDTTLQSFLDMFHHRATALFYAAWEKYRFSVPYERDEADRLTQYLLDFIGLGEETLKRRQIVSDESLINYTGLLALQPRSATALRQLLSDYFEVPVEIEEFVGSWHGLSEEDQCFVGEPAPYSAQLGMGAIAGDEIWDQQGRARIVLGPLSMRQYVDFLPNGSAFEPLRTLVRFFANNETDFEVRLVLKREEVPGMPLGSGDSMPMLGWTTWLRNAPFPYDAGDTVLELN